MAAAARVRRAARRSVWTRTGEGVSVFPWRRIQGWRWEPTKRIVFNVKHFVDCFSFLWCFGYSESVWFQAHGDLGQEAGTFPAAGRPDQKTSKSGELVEVTSWPSPVWSEVCLCFRWSETLDSMTCQENINQRFMSKRTSSSTTSNTEKRRWGRRLPAERTDASVCAARSTKRSLKMFVCRSSRRSWRRRRRTTRRRSCSSCSRGWWVWVESGAV